MTAGGPVDGPISRRLRKLFSSAAKEWHPARPADSGQGTGKVPKGVDGKKLGGRHRKGKGQ